MNHNHLYQRIKKILNKSHPSQGQKIINQVLNDIKETWDGILVQYNHLVKEMISWQQVAEQAVRIGRDDLAKAALRKKLHCKQQVLEYKAHLDQLAALTEQLIELVP